MALKSNFDPKNFESKFEERKAKIIERHIALFQWIGEKFINDGRANGSYKDRTGNLRSSIGYLVSLDGNKINGNITGGTAKGKRQAENYLNQLIEGKGLELLGVAGMEYAIYLEAKGYEVISSSAKWAVVSLKEKLPNVMKL
jgi:hypothetical protein